MIRTWAFEFFPASRELEANFDPAASKAYFDAYLDLWVSAERLGFDGVFLSEHHFGGGYSPSPNLLLPVIAERTRSLRMGVMGNVVPYHSPWRLVEEFGMLDNLLGGRLEIGTSAGIPAEFQRIGMDPGEARARYDEAMQIIDEGLTKGVVTHHGQFWNFDNLTLVPRPLQQPTPPLWTTVISLESARKAARRGSKISTGFVSNEKAREIFDAYNEEAARVGNPTGPDRCGLRRQIVIDADAKVSGERSGAFAASFRNVLESVDKRTISPGRKALDQPGTHGYQLSDDEFVGGDPQAVADTILAQCAETGAGHFMTVFAGHKSLDDLARSWELFGTEVNPQLKRVGAQRSTVDVG